MLSAASENTEKFVPAPSKVAPSGNGLPGQAAAVSVIGVHHLAKSRFTGLPRPSGKMQRSPKLVVRESGPARFSRAPPGEPRRNGDTDSDHQAASRDDWGGWPALF